MADEIPPTTASALTCPWCSASLASSGLERCPSCGAILTGDPAEPLPGVTAVDVSTISRSTPVAVRPRNRLLSWISGEYPEEGPSPDEAKALEPPDPAVKREMLRLELEGEVAALKAHADALVAEAAAEGRVVELPSMPALSESGVAAAEDALIGDDEMPAPADLAPIDLVETPVAEPADGSTSSEATPSA